MSPNVVCTTADFAKRDASDFAGAAAAIVCSSRVGFSLKMSRSLDLSLVVWVSMSLASAKKREEHRGEEREERTGGRTQALTG